MISILRVVFNAQRNYWTVSCDVKKRIQAAWCHYIKKGEETWDKDKKWEKEGVR